MERTPEEEAEDARSMHWDEEIRQGRRRRDAGELREELERARAEILRIDKELGQLLEVEPGNIPKALVAPEPKKVEQWLAGLKDAMVATLGVDDIAHAKALELWNEVSRHFR